MDPPTASGFMLPPCSQPAQPCFKNHPRGSQGPSPQLPNPHHNPGRESGPSRSCSIKLGVAGGNEPHTPAVGPQGWRV